MAPLLTSNSLHDPVKRGLIYLASQQLSNGSFESQSSPTITPWKPARTYSTTFAPAIMLGALSTVPGAQTLRQTLASYLLSQKGSSWSYNYWDKQSSEYTSLPYPDDLDDTSCSLVSLYLHDPALIDEVALVKIVRLLIAAETKPGGPYRTWLTDRSADSVWQDVDLAVNANIAYFISLVSNRLPQLDHYLEQAVHGKAYQSPYYPSEFPLYYYLARSCPSTVRPELTKHIVASWQRTTRPTAFETALTLSSLCKLAPDHQLLSVLHQQILHAQSSDGSWPSSAFCLDPSVNGEHYYNGSSALTTALCLEAVASYRRQPKPRSTTRAVKDRALRLHTLVTSRAESRFKQLGPDLRQAAKLMLDKLIAADKSREITLLPYHFAESMTRPPTLSDQFFVSLGLANLYGWIAYTIYDDFLDDEGQPALLSAANVALRSSLLSFQAALPKHQGFQARVRQTFDAIDSANTWEVTHCRFASDQRSIQIGVLPRYRQRNKLAERSLGHGLTPLAVLLASGKSLRHPEVHAIDQAFRHYLIARQLNDDAHDWKDDFRRGHISYAVDTILRRLKLTGTQSFEAIMPQMERDFWYSELTKLCRIMNQHLANGQDALAKQSLLRTDNVIAHLLNKTSLSVQETLQSQAQAVRFLRSYQAKS